MDTQPLLNIQKPKPNFRNQSLSAESGENYDPSFHDGRHTRNNRDQQNISYVISSLNYVLRLEQHYEF